MLVAGEAPDENRGTWRRSAAAVAQSSPQEIKKNERKREANGRKRSKGTDRIAQPNNGPRLNPLITWNSAGKSGDPLKKKLEWL